MRTLTYGGGSVVTTDRIAGSVVELTAALARRGLAEAVRIPVFTSSSSAQGDADLVLGAGVEVLSVGTVWDAADPPCDDETAALRRLIERVGDAGLARSGAPPVPPHYDRVLDDPEFAHPGADAAEPRPPVRLRPRTRPRERG